MTEEKIQNEPNDEQHEIKIDYDNIDVAHIMEQIKKKIASQPSEHDFDSIPEEALYIDKDLQSVTELEGKASGVKGKARQLLLKIMSPFFPFIKLLVLPVYEELCNTIRILDDTNRRLDLLSKKTEMEIKKLNDELKTTKEYTKHLHSVEHNIIVELTKLKIEEEHLKNKARILEKDFDFLGKREKALEKEILK
ncbi:MAG: hypothetical protein ACOC6P_01260 [Candidatus Aminicenantaceae bacterium]